QASIRDTGAAESAGLRRPGQLLRDLTRVAARIGEGERTHTPVTVCRAADYRHLMLIQLGAYCIHVLDEDDELPDSFLRQAEHVACRAVLLSCAALQEDVRVLEAKHCGLVVLVLHGQSEDLLVERLGAF